MSGTQPRYNKVMFSTRWFGSLCQLPCRICRDNLWFAEQDAGVHNTKQILQNTIFTVVGLFLQQNSSSGWLFKLSEHVQNQKDLNSGTFSISMETLLGIPTSHVRVRRLMFWFLSVSQFPASRSLCSSSWWLWAWVSAIHLGDSNWAPSYSLWPNPALNIMSIRG